MKKGKSKIVPFVLIAFVIIAVLLVVYQRRGSKLKPRITNLKAPAELFTPVAEGKFEELFPKDFDKGKIKDTWQDFREAVSEKRINSKKLREFVTYLKEAAQDKKFTKKEGEKILKLMKESIE